MINRENKNQCNRCEHFKECLEDEDVYTGKTKLFLNDFQVICLFLGSIVVNVFTIYLLASNR